MRHVRIGASRTLCANPPTEGDVSLDDAKRAHASGQSILDCEECRALVSTLVIHTPTER